MNAFRIAVLPAVLTAFAAPAFAADPMIKPGTCELIVAARQSIPEAQEYIRSEVGKKDFVKIFRSENGWYAISIGSLYPEEEDPVMKSWKASGRIPEDSYCTKGSRFVALYDWQSGRMVDADQEEKGGGDLVGQTWFVNSPSDGELKLRRGPGTEFPTNWPLKQGHSVVIEAQAGPWFRINLLNRFGSEDRGWVHGNYLLPEMVDISAFNGDQSSCTAVNFITYEWEAVKERIYKVDPAKASGEAYKSGDQLLICSPDGVVSGSYRATLFDDRPAHCDIGFKLGPDAPNSIDLTVFERSCEYYMNATPTKVQKEAPVEVASEQKSNAPQKDQNADTAQASSESKAEAPQEVLITPTAHTFYDLMQGTLKKAFGGLMYTYKDEDGKTGYDMCSATLIGERHIATAASCVFPDSLVPEVMYFSPGVDGEGEAPFGFFKPVRAFYPKDYLKTYKSKTEGWDSDMVILELGDDAFSGKSAGGLTGDWVPGVGSGFKANTLVSHDVGEISYTPRKFRPDCEMKQQPSQEGMFVSNCVQKDYELALGAMFVQIYEGVGRVGPLGGIYTSVFEDGRIFGAAISKERQEIIGDILEGKDIQWIKEERDYSEEWVEHVFPQGETTSIFVRNRCYEYSMDVVVSRASGEEKMKDLNVLRLKPQTGKYFLDVDGGKALLLVSIDGGRVLTSPDADRVLTSADIERTFNGISLDYQVFDVSGRSSAGFSIECDSVEMN